MRTQLAELAALAGMPFLLSGLQNRVKSLWSGRKGPPLFQLVYDVRRLLAKTPVYSRTTTPLFQIAPWVFLATAVASAALVPLLGATPLYSFRLDFVFLAYLWALGRAALVLAALDTGSAFEGMGAAREALLAALLEPALLLLFGALALHGGADSLHAALRLQPALGAAGVLWAAAALGLLIVLQVETTRVPVDDPATHLELTMVHEVMVLDHGARELAAIQVGAALKLYLGAAMLATLLNPWAGTGGWRCAGANLGLCLCVAAVLGTVESLSARLKLRAVPIYIACALGAAVVALLAAGGGGT
jgi:formate hydrogenlyase subunit 4